MLNDPLASTLAKILKNWALATLLLGATLGRSSPAIGEPLEGPLTDKAVKRLLNGLDDSQPFDGGRYSKVGSAAVYVASTKNIPNFDRLNWVIVRMLSEKYGCFLRSKVNIGNETRYGCRDERTIVFRRYKNRNWMVFHARQFDEIG